VCDKDNVGVFMTYSFFSDVFLYLSRWHDDRLINIYLNCFMLRYGVFFGLFDVSTTLEGGGGYRIERADC
jgi:hypothetical protein